MPLYDFRHPLTEEIKEVFFHMNDEDKIYIDEEGVEWERVFAASYLGATYRTFDEKRLVDEKGKPLKIKKFSDEFIRHQGFKNAADYIDYNNSIIDREKTPEANRQKMHDQRNNKDLQAQLKENKRLLKKKNKEHRKQRESSKSKVTVKTTVDKTGKVTKMKAD